MPDTTLSPVIAVARSPITPAPPVLVRDGWEISGRQSMAPLTLTDETSLTKVQLRCHWSSGPARAIGVPFGRADRRQRGVLTVGSGPGEWLLLAAPGTADEATATLLGLNGQDDGLVTVIDLTHGRALMRLTGAAAAATLAKVCAIDLSDRVTPDGTAFRSSVAKLVTDVIRDDREGGPSYLLHCERSSGQYLFDALLDAGAEHGIEVAGFGSPRT